MTIGQLAKAAGVNVETIRYYQRRGLVTTPSKPLGGQRKYPDEALRQITFVHRAQDLGFTLDEIILLLAQARDGGRDGGRELAKKKVEELERRAAQLNRMRKALAALVAKADGARGKESPIIRALYGEDD
jgi:MerR family mercuric resistance operon transcriptional regulator